MKSLGDESRLSPKTIFLIVQAYGQPHWRPNMASLMRDAGLMTFYHQRGVPFKDHMLESQLRCKLDRFEGCKGIDVHNSQRLRNETVEGSTTSALVVLDYQSKPSLPFILEDRPIEVHLDFLIVVRCLQMSIVSC